MEKGMTKKQSSMLYGTAILMMLYHHLFCAPERLHTDYFSVLDLLGTGVEMKLAWFCKLCVGIYAFISGYGMCMSLKKHKRPELSVRNQGLLACKAAASHLIRFLQSFWLVFVIFIPIGYLLGHYTHVSLRQGVLSFLGLSEVYNIEWWYVRQYILMLLTLPLVDMAFDLLFSVKRKGFTALAGAAVLGAAALLAVYILGRRYTVRAYHFIFLIGYLCARFRIFEWIWKGLRTDIIRRLAGGTMVLACIGIRVHAASFAAYYRSDIVLAPVFVLGFCLLVPQTGRAAEGLVWLGKYSVYMWLVHTFYCYYYFQPMVTFSKISTVMYLVLILVSLLTAMGLCWTLKGLRRLTVGKVKV